MRYMRIALVSPYSWTYPGGVTRHIGALAERFLEDGHHVRVLAPFDPPDRFSAALHRGARPQPADPPPWLVPLGRTLGFKANGAVSNLSITPYGVATLHDELRTGRYDVVHIHEPVAPLTSWLATDWTRLPLVGTFHSYSDKRLPNGIANLIGARRVLNRLHVRIAVSEAAAWTGKRWFGGHYRVIPNGVHVDPQHAALAALRPSSDRLRIAFVGQAVERKGLPLLLRAFEALREHIPTELTVIGPTSEELSPLLLDPRGVTALGKVDEAEKQRVLEAADVLCAPSLGARELRHGSDGGFCGRDAGGGVGYRRLPRRRSRRSTACSCRSEMLRRWPRRCATSTRSPSAVRRWPRPPHTTWSASRGRGWPRRCWAPTRMRSRLRHRPVRRRVSPSRSALDPLI